MSSRKKISSKVRQMVYEKCNHRCAYCGCELDYKDMQVDHIESVYKHDFEKYRFGTGKLTEEELNSIENYMPACRACNFYKSTFSLEKFRENLTTKLYENLRKNFNYKLMCKYGIIKEDLTPIEFYFERLMNKKIKVTELDIIVTMVSGEPYYEIKYKPTGQNHCYIGYSSYYLSVVVGYKNEYFTVVEEEQKSLWTLCSEGLPEKDTDVLVSLPHGQVTVMRYLGDGVFGGIFKRTTEVIDAWMPLPEPYKERKK